MKPTLVVARIPFLPVATAIRLFDAEDPFKELRVLLREEPSILSAIYVASPSLHDGLQRWLDDASVPDGTAALRAIIYVIRMSARCTPYGLFAGIGEVAVGEDATLRLGDAWKTLTRPDMGVALDVAKAVSEGPQGPAVRYSANRSVIERGDRIYSINLHLTNQAVKDGEVHSEQRMASMRHTAAVREVRALSAEPIARGALAAALAERLGESEENGIRFVDRMIESGILVSEFDLAPLGNPQRRLADRLRQIDGETGDAFTALLDRTDALDGTTVVARSADEYRTLANAFVELAEGKPGTPLHVDLVATFEGTLPDEVLREVRRGADILERTAEPVEMKAYRERFMERYEGTDRMVPLLEMVDSNFGLGSPEAVTPVREIDAKFDRLVQRIAYEAEHAHRAEVELSDDEFAQLFPKPETLRQRGDRDFIFAVLAESAEALQRGDFRVSVHPMTGRATQSMGRFALALGPEFTERMQVCARAGNDRGELTAELVYPTFGRMYNVSTRPSTADAELHIGVGESHDCETVLSPNDLWVGLENDRFILWSQSLQRRIRVVESHLFVTARASTNVCRFLALLAQQDRDQLPGFRWGKAGAFCAFPRVTYRRLVLSPRMWTFDAAQLGKSVESAGTGVATLREFWQLPRYVFLVQGDNLLLLDLSSSLSAHLLHDQIEETGTVSLVEMLSDPSQLWIESSKGRHVAEFVAAFPADGAAPASDAAVAPVIVTDRKRYGPGSEWAYAKFYVDRHATDSFIAVDIAQLIDHLQKECEVDRWFFLRYADPVTHVRVRVRSLNHAETARKTIARVAETWLASRRIERYAFDTYDPEYERYGGPGELDAVETFFTEDSAGCVELLKTLGHTDDDRVAGAAASFDALLQGAPGADALVIGELGKGKRLSVGAEDRSVLKSIQNESKPRPSHLEAALKTDDIARRIGAILHMHCNRLGVSGEAELRVGVLVRSAALSRRSRSTSKRDA